ncbi:hypothetical protein GmHk_16G046526 [Glycine max]|nr:hypothetical protein GmHk_16G046526 [Glycine max]
MFFYRQPNYICDGYVAYDCMELKHDDNVGKMFFIYSEYSSEGSVVFNATFGHFPDEILAQLHKPRKLRMIDEIIALTHDEFM